MRGVPLNQRLRRVLSVTLTDGMALTLDDTPSSFFPVHISQPQGENTTADISPRQGRATSTLWLGARLSILLKPCDRIKAGETVYELLAAPREVTEGRSTIGYRAPVLPVGELYPRTAAVHALGDDDPAGEIECSVFSLAHRGASRGEYDDSFGEAPASALEVLEGVEGSNVELRFDGGERWKVRSFSLSREVPFVAMQLTVAR